MRGRTVWETAKAPIHQRFYTPCWAQFGPQNQQGCHRGPGCGLLGSSAWRRVSRATAINPTTAYLCHAISLIRNTVQPCLRSFLKLRIQGSSPGKDVAKGRQVVLRHQRVLCLIRKYKWMNGELRASSQAGVAYRPRTKSMEVPGARTQFCSLAWSSGSFPVQSSELWKRHQVQAQGCMRATTLPVTVAAPTRRGAFITHTIPARTRQSENFNIKSLAALLTIDVEPRQHRN